MNLSREKRFIVSSEQLNEPSDRERIAQVAKFLQKREKKEREKRMEQSNHFMERRDLSLPSIYDFSSSREVSAAYFTNDDRAEGRGEVLGPPS